MRSMGSVRNVDSLRRRRLDLSRDDEFVRDTLGTVPHRAERAMNRSEDDSEFVH